MSTPEVGAVVVGSGIAGLAGALELQAREREVLVIDALDRPGGVMRTDHMQGYVIERGPNTFQVKAPMLAFLRGLGCEDELLRAQPASRLRCVYRDGELVPVPLSPLALARTPLLSTKAKLRLLAEPFVRRGDAAGESAAEFAARRLGREVVTNLLGPFLTGVYAGDENCLGAEAVFGELAQHERRHGSIALGALRGALRRRRARGLAGTYSTEGGLGPFARRLAERLVEPPAMETRVTALERRGEVWELELSGPGGQRGLRARRVLLAAPAPTAAVLLRDACPEASEALAGIAYVPIASVAMGVRPDQVRAPIEGFGFLVPRDAGLSLLGCLFMSRLFPGRAPAGHELLQCMLGGQRWPEAVDLPDDVVQKRLLADLEGVLGLCAEPRLLTVTRWPRAIPQPGRDHVRRIAEVRRRVAGLPGLALAGGYLDGVAVPDALASGLRAARELDDGADPGGLGV